MNGESVGAWITAIVVRTAAFAVAWWAISEGDASMALYGAAVVPLAVASSLVLLRPRREFWQAGAWRGIPGRARAAVELTVWFLWRSVRGAVDVARRALTTPPDLDPGMLEHRFTAQRRASRVAVALLLTLMPGSLASGIDGDVLHVHMLHRELPVRAQLERLERLVMRVLEPG